MEKDNMLADIALLMDSNHVHEHTDNATTLECVKELLTAVTEAWDILDSVYDNAVADEWQNKWSDVWMRQRESK